MKLVDKNGKFVGLNNLVENAIRDYYENDDTSPYAFSKLTPTEKKHQLSEMVLFEYAEIAQQVISLGINVIRSEIEKSTVKERLLTNSGLDNVVMRSMGDVTKLPDYTHINYIIKYSKELNAANKHPSAFETAYTNAIITCETTLALIKANAPHFKNAIQQENLALTSNNVEDRVIALFFYSIIYQLFNTTNLLFGKCFNAEFDFNNRPVIAKHIKFEYDGKSHEEDLAFLEAFNSYAKQGGLRDFLIKFDSAKADRKGISNVAQMNKRIVTEGCLRDQLNHYTPKLLTENVGDVAFAFISSSKVLDLLFLPIYVIRYMIYLFKYTVVSYSLISDQIAKSVEILKKQSLTQDDFRTFKTQINEASDKDERASTMAYSKLESHVKEDKASINNLKQTSAGGNGNSLMI